MSMQEISQAYARHYLSWKAYMTELTGRISSLLEEDQIRFSMKSRIKALESLSEKISFLGSQGDQQEIKDLLGLRVVVPFQEGVEQVVTSLRQHFPVDEIERKSDQLSYREFAYDSVHVCVPIERDLGLPGCCRPVIEVQVRTILQDAWAEVEHELIYKNHFRFPNNESIRKKLAALNANLTLSDMIFQEIRDSQKEMERWGRGRFRAMIDKAVDFQGPVRPQVIEQLETAQNAQEGTTASRSGQGGNTRTIEKYMMDALKAHNDEDYRTAVHFYTMVLELNPELNVRSVVFNHRGMAHFMLQHETQALSDFDRSFQCDRSNYRSLNYRAMVLRRLGYVDQALECFEHSLSINANQSEVYFLRGQTLAEVDRDAEAVNDLRQSLTLDERNEDARRLLEKLQERDGATVPQQKAG